jgi:hypothetical protein
MACSPWQWKGPKIPDAAFFQEFHCKIMGFFYQKLAATGIWKPNLLKGAEFQDSTIETIDGKLNNRTRTSWRQPRTPKDNNHNRGEVQVTPLCVRRRWVSVMKSKTAGNRAAETYLKSRVNRRRRHQQKAHHRQRSSSKISSNNSIYATRLSWSKHQQPRVRPIVDGLNAAGTQEQRHCQS